MAGGDSKMHALGCLSSRLKNRQNPNPMENPILLFATENITPVY
jgi:hypothetical protein